MLKRFFAYFGKYKKYLYLSCLCAVGEGILELVIPMLMADIVDIGVATRDKHFILMRGGEMVLFAVISLGLGVIFARLSALAGQGFGSNLRQQEYDKVQSFSFGTLDHFRVSSLITRLSGDVGVIQNAISNGLRPLVRSPVMLITALIVTFMMDWQLSLVFLVAIPLLAGMLYLILRALGPRYKKMQTMLDKVNGVIQENLIAIRVVKAFVTGKREEEKFDAVNDEYQDASYHAFAIASLNLPCFQLIMYSTIIGIMWFGGSMVQTGGLAVGKLTGFLSYVLQILNSLMMLSNVFLLLTRSSTSAQRIMEVIDAPAGLAPGTDPSLKVENGAIDFDHVYFKYHTSAKENVLRNVTLHIPSGATVGILGGTGSAKSSLVQLIPRLYDVSGGDVRVGGYDVRNYGLEHLHDAVGMVLQRNTLFSGTIRENLLWGDPNASKEDLDRALAAACADEFISLFPEGIETDLGQGGVNVSGGQKQRLCIARALLKRPKILIFDDSTSAVDTLTEAKIRRNLAECLPDTTKLIVAQRISSVQEADMIIVMDDGRISAVGTHEELLENSLIYKDIYRLQARGGVA